MELIKDNWTKKDIKEFQGYLKALDNNGDKQWIVNILNTTMPVLFIKSPVLKEISKSIYKGNYTSFLDYMLFEYYENTIINGYLIPKIKDFSIMKKYLDIYSEKVDNWSSCDVLKFNVNKNEKEYFTLVEEYIKSDKLFKRRIGLSILFNYIKKDDYLDKVFKILNGFYEEKEYYVNMMIAWIVCECFIKQRDKTLLYLGNNKLNKFVINKSISKCRDSFRVTMEDKELLNKFKV